MRAKNDATIGVALLLLLEPVKLLIYPPIGFPASVPTGTRELIGGAGREGTRGGHTV